MYTIFGPPAATVAVAQSVLAAPVWKIEICPVALTVGTAPAATAVANAYCVPGVAGSSKELLPFVK